jgi:hypothetical protein
MRGRSAVRYADIRNGALNAGGTLFSSSVKITYCGKTGGSSFSFSGN